MSISEDYLGQNILISYLKERSSKSSYRGFLSLHCNVIIGTVFSNNWKELDNAWATHFLVEGENLLDKNIFITLKNKVRSERKGSGLESFWKRIIAEYEKKQVEIEEKKKDLVSTTTGSKIYNLRKRNNIVDYNEERMAKRITENIKRQSVQSVQSTQSPSDTEETIKNYETDENEQNNNNFNNFADFDFSYQNLDPTKMWTLESTGRTVEKVIYEYARTLNHESYLHSFIINDTDKKTKSLFQKEEWEEIFSTNLKDIPKINKSVIELMKKYSLTDLTLFQNVIFESFLPTNTSYSKENHFDLNYVNHAYRSIHFLWENDDFTLDSSRLEGWYQHNIWSSIIDPAFCNSKINLIRGEGMSMASSDRKNDSECEEICEGDRKKIGRKGDGIFRLSGNRLEFGAIEAGRKWEGKHGKKYLTDSLKLSKMLRDMLIQLATECNNDEKIIRKLQTVGMLHSANKFQLLTMDIPKGHICRIQRFDFHEVSGCINNPPLAFVLKDILRAKAIIMQTLKLLQEKKSNLDELDDKKEVSRLERSTTPTTISLSKTHKTPTTVRTKDVIS